MPDNNAVFNEVMAIEIDKLGFQKQLDELAIMFEKFMAGIGSKAGQVFQMGGMQQLNQQVEGLAKEVADFNLQMHQLVRDTHEKISGIIDAQDNREEAVHQKKRARNRKTSEQAVSDKLEAERKIAEAEGRVSPSTSQQQPPPRRRRSSGGGSEDDDENAAKKRMLLRQIEADNQKRRNLYGAEMRDQAEAMFLAEQKNLAVTRDAGREREKAAKENEKYIKRAQREQEKLDAQNRGFFARLSTGWKQAAAHAVKYFFLFQAIAGIQMAVLGALAVPFKALFDGIKYLQNVEKQGNELAGVLHANVEFSKDLATNLNMAQEAAKLLVRELENRSLALGIKPEQLKGTFQALVGAGAAQGVKNFRELVDLTVMFQGAIKSLALGDLVAQSAIADIPKLFKRIPDEGNKFLEVLHLTRREWIGIREEGMKHKNLVTQLAPLMRPHLEGLEKAKLGQAVMLEQLKLIIARIEGLGAEELFDLLSTLLQSFNKWLMDNSAALAAWLQSFASTFLSAAKTLSIFTGTMGIFRAASGHFLLIWKLLTEVVNGFGISVLWVKKALGDLDVAIMRRTWPDPKKFAGALVQQGENSKELADAIEKHGKTQDLLNKLIMGEKITNPELEKKIQAILDSLINPKNPPSRKTSNNPMGVIRSEYSKELEALNQVVDDIKDKYADLRDATLNSVSEREMTYARAADHIRGYIEAEAAAIEETIARMRKAAYDAAAEASKSTSFGTDADAAAAATNIITEFQRKERGLRNYLEKQKRLVTKADRDANKEWLDLQDAAYKHKLEVIKQQLDAERDMAKQLADAGFMDSVQLHDREQEIQKKFNQATIDEIDIRLKRETFGTREWLALLNERAMAEREYQAGVKTAAQIRIELLKQEEYAKRDHVLRMQSLDNQMAESILSLQRALSGRDMIEAIQGMYDARNKELDASQRELEIRLKAAEAIAKEGAEARKLREELSQLRRERLSSLEAEMEEIDRTSSNNMSSYLRRRIALDRRLPGLRADSGDAAADAAIAAEKDRNSIGLASARALLGFDPKEFSESWRLAETSMEKFATAADFAGVALSNIQGIIGVFKSGKAAGGMMGGVGALMSQFGGAIPGPVGSIMQLGGQVLSLVGGILKAQAKKIAEDVKKQFEKTVTAFQRGEATLARTIASLESQRTSAIQRLSGKKGGKDELEQLLPGMEQQIWDLKNQQKQVIENFDNALAKLRLHNDSLAEVNDKWTAINKQVKEYIGAGGNAAKAAEFLSLSLGKMREEASKTLREGEQEAIKETLRLNDLLKQRVDLAKDFAQQEFDLINADSIEKRTAGSVTRGRDLQKLRDQHQEQMDNLDAEIALATQQVSRYQEIYDLTGDTAALKRRDEAITLAALDEQIERLRTMKKLVEGITLGPNGWSAAPGVLGNTTINVTVGGDVSDPEALGRKIGDSIADEMERRYRQRPSMY